MKYGFPEEKDLTKLHRKVLGEGVAWGCSYLNGFLESLNTEDEGRFTVLVRTPGECDFCDFVFATGNRICAVSFDIDFWGQRLFTYKRRMKLIEASLEHRLMPIVVNLVGCPCSDGSFSFSSAKERWMTDPVSDVSVIPEMGGKEDWELRFPLDDWAAELYAKHAARQALERRGFKIARMYPNNRFFWTTDGAGKPTWVLLSFHHVGMKDPPDYGDFDNSTSEVAGKAGYGVDVAISNDRDESVTGAGFLKPVYRSRNVVAEVVSMTRLDDATQR